MAHAEFTISLYRPDVVIVVDAIAWNGLELSGTNKKEVSHVKHWHHRLCGGLLVTALLSGCGNGKTSTQRNTFPVSGQVFYRKQTILDAVVRLTPVTPPQDDKPLYLPHGTVDEAGLFTISTYDRGDGAPPGKYQVSFSWVGPLKGVSEDEEDRLPERLPRKYTNPQSSGFTVTVKKGNNVLPQFVLQ